MSNDDYDLIPHAKLKKLEDQIEALKGGKGGASPQLQQSMDDLSGSLKAMITVFTEAKNELRIEDEEKELLSSKIDPILQKLDGLLDQNEKIAEGILSLADMIKRVETKVEDLESQSASEKNDEGAKGSFSSSLGTSSAESGSRNFSERFQQRGFQPDTFSQNQQQSNPAQSSFNPSGIGQSASSGQPSNQFGQSTGEGSPFQSPSQSNSFGSSAGQQGNQPGNPLNNQPGNSGGKTDLLADPFSDPFGDKSNQPQQSPSSMPDGPSQNNPLQQNNSSQNSGLQDPLGQKNFSSPAPGQQPNQQPNQQFGQPQAPPKSSPDGNQGNAGSMGMPPPPPTPAKKKGFFG
ncbi:MAG: hypothetical protein ACMXYE_03255 [Candidatus Woesearchaeota archaeon]